jgi:excisionase family DNA binding protein
VADDREPADKALPERLALGAASRMLGVDPDTLRRWADEGRVPAFTTPGGHRRFERRGLERLIAERQTGPTGRLAGLGAIGDHLSTAYRRRYGGVHGEEPDLRTSVPAADRGTFRDAGRRLVDALVRYLDDDGPARERAEQTALDVAGVMASRLARHGVPLADAVTMFVSARRPFLAELKIMARREGVDGVRIGGLYDTATDLLDRLLLAFVAAHAAGSASSLAGSKPEPASSRLTDHNEASSRS